MLATHHRDAGHEKNDMDEMILPPNQIFKNVEFEIESDRASQISGHKKVADTPPRIEAWELPQHPTPYI
jgi:hypothetical protein